MDDIISIFKNHRLEILKNWLGAVFPDSAQNAALNGIHFESPLYYQVNREFVEVLDYLLSDDPQITRQAAPVAKTLVKFKALNAQNSAEVVNYPLQLRNSLTPFFSYLENKNIEILLSVDIRIEHLLLAAFDFYLNTREEIYKIKLKELERGVLAGETSGCPSGHI